MLFKNEIICTNLMYEILFKDCYNYFYNQDIILSMLNNFKDKLANFYQYNIIEMIFNLKFGDIIFKYLKLKINFKIILIFS